ncbi:BZ3500_MvSof-1268-A1-R1_Chr3-1g05726 [Microbotryum saponariae]|uniref:BZ3500_MvSof-1268-A1-R1_Chr3-1g05726 protein n=1 Tax=Microbotryum saponariae TaxID=289078 RepID=A0A2X0L0L8_9BASI|nr:BZ3500_MvSof-1268-A1-R1_Chr3-1g05726 [Microbotryum saponariae]SDA04916.1 BZ3501_MvSof-1269-A2-R1_Chr3-1g05396 [Microbotryum saponariae]
MFDHTLSTYCSVTIDFAPPPSMDLFRAGEEACSKRNPTVERGPGRVGGRHGRGSDGLWAVCCGCQDWRGFIAGEAHKMSKYGEGVHSLGLGQARSIIMHHHDSSC